MSEMCSTRLAENTGHKKLPSGHHRTTLSAISSQLSMYWQSVKTR